ncbi:hypothetical protein K2173_007829 [Erythroxylum novogranatense]|uniref:J domain-containing protein n=1 Tax=Erythroxylum novogranatense TaxID=1862640 RepID=A0AAV8TIL4_9ROSI|nr:hypothetical protein K2173_007829 [Erythroxylum novogranatense]
MDGNKDEALKCVLIAEEAIAADNKERALKFIKIAQRLNREIVVDELLAACERVELGTSASSVGEKGSVNGDERKKAGSARCVDDVNGGRSYAEEHVQLVRRINRNKDYYAILGVEKTCSVEEIRKAYKKLSLRVHPDKNLAPGSDEAFKKVSNAFKCLSDTDSRRRYDQMGLIEEFGNKQTYNVRRPKRRRHVHDFYENDMDPDEIFRSFFGQAEKFRARNTYRSRGMASHEREGFHIGPYLILLLQILPVLLILVLAYLPTSEPNYSLHKNYAYQILKTTEKYGIEYFVKSLAFDERFPPGSPAREDIENTVTKDYRKMLWRYCHIEVQRRSWNRNLPTPSCIKLQNLGSA